MPGAKSLGGLHACDLAKGSDSCLPRLPPQASKFKRWFRNWRKQLTVSTYNTKCSLFFRSRAAISAEKKQHIRSPYWYVIHPFSEFCTYREVVMSCLWLFAFFKDPFTIAFFPNNAEDILNDPWRMIDVLVDVIMLANIVLCFFTGFYRSRTKEVVLEPKKISKYYLQTFFFFDLLGTIPYHYVLAKLLALEGNLAVYSTLLACLHFVRFVRIKTLMAYLRTVTELLHVGNSLHEIICLLIVTFYLLHWWACIIYIIPKMKHESYGSLPATSWVVKADIQPGTSATTGRKYIESMLSAMCHFYRAGNGMYLAEEMAEQVAFSLIMISGTLYFSYVIVIILEMVGSANASESKYEELIHELEHYMRIKKLPSYVRIRLIMYYENRFQKHFFREQAILSTLSEHLRYEIFLQSCKGLIEKVTLFQGLSKATIGTIVGFLKHEVFLPSDVIIKKTTLAECMYFISYGTVAIILPNGKEFCHLEDGEYFGEIALLITDDTDKRLCSVVAVEITEVFRLERKDLNSCIKGNDELAERLEKVAQERLQQLTMLTEQTTDEAEDRKDVLHELRKGKILEHSHQRRRK